MYRKQLIEPTTIELDVAVEGETIEERIDRMLNNGEGITDGAPIIYTERAEGVRPEFNIKTDRFDLAIDAMDHVAKAGIAKREQGIADRKKVIEDHNSAQKGEKNEVGDQSTQGSDK